MQRRKEDAPEGMTELVTPSGGSFLSEQICFLWEILNCANLCTGLRQSVNRMRHFVSRQGSCLELKFSWGM